MGLFDIFRKPIPASRTARKNLVVPVTNPELASYYAAMDSEHDSHIQARLLERILRYVAMSGRFLVVVDTLANPSGRSHVTKQVVLEKGNAVSRL